MSQRLRGPGGAGLPTGRLRLLGLAALAAAFFLVPAAAASAANPPVHIVINGSGSGEVIGEAGPTQGTPRIECKYVSPGPQTGVCDAEAGEDGGLKGVVVQHIAAAGSKFAGWKVPKGVAIGCEVEKPSAGSCAVVSFGTEIKIEATFEPSGPPPLALTINEPGAGTGQVNCEVNGGPTVDKPCASTYPEGTDLKLIAAPGEGSEFAGYSAGTGSAASCSTSPCGPFKLEAASELDALFELEEESFSVSQTGEGAVSCEDEGSPAPCSGPFLYGHTIKVAVTEETGWELKELIGTGSAEGECDEGTGTCEFEITEASTVSVVFQKEPVIDTHIVISGSGSGKVLGVPGETEGKPAVNCSYVSPGPQTGACDVEHGEEAGLPGITVEEEAAPGSAFAGWTVEGEGALPIGCEEPLAPTCGVALFFGEMTIKAVFNRIPHTLTVEASGEGEVSAEEPPEPVSGAISGCEEGECSAEYGEGQTVTLKATPDEHRAVEWEGCDSEPSATECEVEISEDKTVKAKFVSAPQGTLTVEASGEGEVEALEPPEPVSGAISGCEEGECSAVYYQGETVTLLATPGEHQRVAWSGCTPVGGEPNECEVEVDSAAVGVEATFTQITHTLTVTTAGSGKVNASSGGISGCSTSPAEGTCSGPYNEASKVTLTAVPNAHQKFKEWSGPDKGACTTASTCEVTIPSGNAAVTATFEPIAHTLTVTTAGQGKVNASSGAISGCSTSPAEGTCSGPYNEASKVTLTAVPNAHQKFKEWSGPDKGACTTASTCEVTIPSGNAAVTATFEPIAHTLTVTVSGPGSLSASGSPAPVSGSISGCTSAGGSACTATYNEADTVTLTATPGAHQQIAWSGCDSHTATACTVAVNADTSVTDTETTIKHTLTVSKAGSGSGSVSCDGGACAATYDEGTEVTLAASAASGSTFAGWSGAGCSGTGTCKVTLNADTAVTATFNANPVDPEKTCANTPSLCPPPPPSCVVPKLAKKTLGQARSALSAAHCALGKVSKPKKKKKGPLVVKSSSPGAGTVLPANSKVNLKLGPKPKKKK